MNITGGQKCLAIAPCLFMWSCCTDKALGALGALAVLIWLGLSLQHLCPPPSPTSTTGAGNHVRPQYSGNGKENPPVNDDSHLLPGRPRTAAVFGLGKLSLKLFSSSRHRATEADPQQFTTNDQQSLCEIPQPCTDSCTRFTRFLKILISIYGAAWMHRDGRRQKCAGVEERGPFLCAA